MLTFYHKIYRRLNRILCAALGHPVWGPDRYGGWECECGKVYHGDN